jgi:hypothetical protein
VALVGVSKIGEEMVTPLAQYTQWSTPTPQANGLQDEMMELQEVLLLCNGAT